MATNQSNDVPVIINQWTAAVNRHDLDTTCNLYSSKAILVPSMSDELKKSAGAIKEYLGQLIKKDSFKVEILDITSQNLEDIDVYTGVYIFSWTTKGKPHKTSARFTFVIHNDKIIQHHSSVTP